MYGFFRLLHCFFEVILFDVSLLPFELGGQFLELNSEPSGFYPTGKIYSYK